MSQPDYENDLVFEPDMTWEEFREWCNSNNYIEEEGNYEHRFFIYFGTSRDYMVTQGKELCIFRQGSFIPLETFKSYKSLKRVITAILEGVEK